MKTLVAMMLLAGLVAVAPALAADEAVLPDGFKNFRGVLKGTISSKTENSLVLKVEAVVKSFPKSTATKPEEIVGKEVTLQVKAERLVKVLKDLAVGDKVEVGAINEGNVVVAVEQLSKVVAEPKAEK